MDLELKIAATAGGAKVRTPWGTHLYLDWTMPGRTLIARVTPFRAIEAVVVPVEPKNKEGVVDLAIAYLEDHAECCNCGQVLPSPGYCDPVCAEQAGV